MGSLRERDLKRNRDTLNILQSNTLDAHSVHVLVSGSRAEGLSLHPDWGHKIPDVDTMWLYGGPWCVHTSPVASQGGAYLQIQLRGVKPGYCRVRVEGDINELAAELGKTSSIRGAIGTTKAEECIINRQWLSSPAVFRALRDLPTGDGPADADGLSDLEFVPALVCTGPIEAVQEFVFRERKNKSWPKKSTLQTIKELPTLIVAAGHKLSEFRLMEWRLSMSIPELLLANDMPLWVKQGYWTFKYSMLRAIEEQRGVAVASDYGRSTVGSYHFKTILLWELERRVDWEDGNSVTLFINLIQRLRKCLAVGNLPHYFFPDCNLFGCMDKIELRAAEIAAWTVWQVPLSAIIYAPEYPNKVYGGEAERYRLLVCLRSLLASRDGELVMDTGGDLEHEKQNLRAILNDIDKIRERRWRVFQENAKQPLPPGPMTLVTLPGELFPPWVLDAENISMA